MADRTTNQASWSRGSSGCSRHRRRATAPSRRLTSAQRIRRRAASARSCAPVGDFSAGCDSSCAHERLAVRRSQLTRRSVEPDAAAIAQADGASPTRASPSRPPRTRRAPPRNRWRRDPTRRRAAVRRRWRDAARLTPRSRYGSGRCRSIVARSEACRPARVRGAAVPAARRTPWIPPLEARALRRS